MQASKVCRGSKKLRRKHDRVTGERTGALYRAQNPDVMLAWSKMEDAVPRMDEGDS